eukprot:CAMPEP_0116024480 /NCGR_PEP_ID=MMETSP0321-20121206/12339_1 /TAXON_ID=163516 /ORGANISM="Leptocylindrus danicus var. danicus, Strain B650" /LENGTH=594 /DNA_ID=CAMNT_0003496213 /DNA_START=52 /DNA_END=1836 /DNA_ORIENTATION=+
MMMNTQAAPEITDPVLSWGSSVTENDEMRRYVKIECDELDKKISNVRSQLSTEELSKRSLKKDVKYGKNEMRNLQRRSADELERVSTNDSIRQRLAEQLHNALGKLVAEDDRTNIRGGTNVVSPHVSPRGSESIGNGRQQPASLSSFLVSGKEEFLKLSQRIKQAAKEKENNCRMLAEIENETRLVEDRIINGNLNGERDAMSAEYDTKKRELENEKAKSRSVMEQVQRIRIKSGEYAAQIAEQTKSQSELRKKYEEQERALKLQVGAAGEMEAQLRAEIAELESNYIALQDKRDGLKRQRVEIETIQNREREAKEKREAIRKAMEVLEKDEAQAKNNLDQASQANDAAKFQLENALEEEKSLEKDIAESDSSEKSGEVKGANADRMKLAEEKERLAGIIEAVARDPIDPSISEAALADAVAAMNTAKAEKVKVDDAFSAVESQCAEQRQELVDLKTSINNEIDSLIKMRDSLKAANIADRTKNEEIEKDFELEKVRCFDVMKNEKTIATNNCTFRQKLLIKARICLKNEAEEVKRMDEEPIMLSDAEGDSDIGNSVASIDGEDDAVSLGDAGTNASQTQQTAGTAESEPSQTP